MTTLVRVKLPRLSVTVCQHGCAYAFGVGKPGTSVEGWEGWYVSVWYYDALCPTEVYPPTDIAPHVVGVAQCRDGWWWVVEPKKARPRKH